MPCQLDKLDTSLKRVRFNILVAQNCIYLKHNNSC